MTTVVDTTVVAAVAPDRRRAVPAVALAVVAVVDGVVGAVDGADVTARVAGMVAVIAAGAAATIAWRKPTEPLGALVAVVAAVVGLAVAAPTLVSDAGTGDTIRLWATAAACGVAAHLGLALPDGRLHDTPRRGAAVAGYAAAALMAVVSDGRLRFGVGVAAAFAVASTVVVVAYASRCRRAGPVDRARLQWTGWGVVVAGLVALLTTVLHQLLGWPSSPAAVSLLASGLVPVALALGSVDRLAVRIDRLLTHTIVVAGLASLVAAVYLVVVLGLGDAPDDESRRLLALSMVAAMVAAALALPTRRRLDELAHRRVYGERRSPEEALQTFGSRMSRAVPMDELLLQLAETLKASMKLSGAEVWTGRDGVLDRVVSVPERGPRRVVLNAEELNVVTRARASGNAWVTVWMPELLTGRPERLVRVAPVAHSGELLGLLYVERAADALPFGEEEERALVELSRQVALALHNLRLDSALQASLHELELRNEQLQASRLRIVTAADESRRAIERNLHDGAQQHLVALAVKVGLIKQLLEADPSTAETLLDELRGDVQATLTELRDLAHGIYPPLLRERGLGEALRAAAKRSTLATSVRADDVARYSTEVEAAVYFCCLEAMQNAAKHAGEDAEVAVTAGTTPGGLWVEIADDGAGFDPATVTGSHGFVNMEDRLGAVGGTLDVVSAPGQGTTIRCVVPAQPRTD